MEQRIFTNFAGREFTQIKNQAVRDEELSWKARGILAYLASLPSDWIVYKSEIMKHSIDKKDSFNSGWNELKRAGYIKGIQNRNKGKFTGYTWYVSDDRQFMLPETDFPSSDKPKYEKPATTNTYLTNTNYINNIDTKIDTREMFLHSYNKMFISEKTLELFLNFGELLETKEFLDIIFQTKKYVEKRARTNSETNHERQYRITGDFWTTEIEKIAFRFILKMKEGIQKEKKIKNIKAYWNTTMTTLWENVYLMEKAYGKATMQVWYEQGELELEEFLFESKENFSSQQEWQIARKNFIYQSH